MIEPGITGSAAVLVDAGNTASAMGSGDLEVLATPALAALAERACRDCAAPFLAPGETTVGSRIELDHTSATPVGMEVRCVCELLSVEGRRLTFKFSACDPAGSVGSGLHVRYIVDSDRFLQKAKGKCQK